MLAIKELEQRFNGRHASPHNLKVVHNEKVVGVRKWILAVCEGDLHTATFLAQIIFLGKISKQNGKDWFYKEAKEWKEELGLSRWHLEKARKFCIAAGFLEEKRKRLEHKNACVVHYKVNLEAIKRALELITLVKEENGTLQELLDSKSRTAARRQARQQNYKRNRARTVSRASTQMKFNEKVKDLERQQPPAQLNFREVIKPVVKVSALSIEDNKRRASRYKDLISVGKSIKEAKEILIAEFGE